MSHIFISYAKKDTRKLALSLAEALNEIIGVTAWVDRSLRAGRSWELQIQTEIDRCDAMIVLYSPDLNRHQQGQSESYVLTEIAYAKYTAQKLIIPVMAQTTTPPISLTMEHYIDFTIDGVELHNLVEALCDELEIELRSFDTTPVTAPSKPVQKPNSKNLMPQPFAWVDIPTAHVKLPTNEEVNPDFVNLEAYSISKYPITNAQFAKFIEAGGYKNKNWWTEKGWQKCQEGWHDDNRWRPSGTPWTEPCFWKDSKWNDKDQPVVGVSWFEAVAFCLWLSDATGEKIRLPSGDQWQYAAQGDDGRAYPWGNKWNSSKCQNSVDGGFMSAGNTSPVTQYEGKGDSPFGVVDMAGNVQEWCLTNYESNENKGGIVIKFNVACGGSWYNVNIDNFRCGFRNIINPRPRNVNHGFRISIYNTYY